MVDYSQFFSPAAWGGWNPPSQDLFPRTGPGGIAATPSGMMGNAFGLRRPTPPTPPVSAVNPQLGDANPAGGGGVSAPGVMMNQGVTATTGDANPAAAGGGLSSVFNNMKMPSPEAIKALQGILSPPAIKAPQNPFQPIQMAQPVGAGAGQGVSSPMAGLLSSLMNRAGQGVSQGWGGMGLPGGGATL